jgi:hypothetical protein
VPAPAASSRLVEDWNAAADEVRRRADRVRQEVATRSGRSRSTLNPTTLDLIRDPTSIEAGHRHRTIFSAAADLAEFGTVEDLVVALLTEPGLDTGLPPREVIRQIQTGIAHARHTHEGDAE